MGPMQSLSFYNNPLCLHDVRFGTGLDEISGDDKEVTRPWVLGFLKLIAYIWHFCFWKVVEYCYFMKPILCMQNKKVCSLSIQLTYYVCLVCIICFDNSTNLKIKLLVLRKQFSRQPMNREYLIQVFFSIIN